MAFMTGDVITATDLSSIAVVAGNHADNGRFEVWQRGTTSTNCPSGTPTFLADRWAVVAAGATMTQARSTSVPAGSKARYSVQVTGAASGTTCNVRQRKAAEDVAQMDTTQTFKFQVYNSTGAAFSPVLLLGTPSAADNFTTVTNRLTQTLQSCPDGAWTEISYSVDISAYTNLANGLQVELQIPSGSLSTTGKSVLVTCAHIHDGDDTQSFPNEPAAVGLARCQRYYQRVGPYGTTNLGFGSGAIRTTTFAEIDIGLPVTMRAAPVVTFSAGNDFRLVFAATAVNTTAMAASATPSLVTVTATVAGGLTAGYAARLDNTQDPTNAAIDFNAEL